MEVPGGLQSGEGVGGGRGPKVSDTTEVSKHIRTHTRLIERGKLQASACYCLRHLSDSIRDATGGLKPCWHL